MVPAGMYSRLAIGSIILTHAIAYNETGAITVLFAAFVATVCATLSGDLKNCDFCTLFVQPKSQPKWMIRTVYCVGVCAFVNA